MALTVGTLVQFLHVDTSGWRRGMRNARDDVDGLHREAAGRLGALRGRFASEGDASGKGWFSRLRAGFLDNVGEMASTFMTTLKSGLTANMSGLSQAFSSNPYIAAAGVAMATTIVAVAAPLIGALLGAALIGGAGLGTIGIAAMILKEEPAVAAAATRLKTTLGNTLKDAAKPLVGPMAAAMDKLTATFSGDKITGPLKQAFEAIGPAIGPLADGLGKLAENAMPGLVEMVKAAVPVLGVLADKMPALGNAISMAFSAIAGGKDGAALALGDIISMIIGLVATIGMWIGWLSKAYAAIRGFFVSIPGWVSSAGSAIAGWWGTITGWLSSLWTTVTSWPGKIAAMLAAAASAVVAKAGQIVAWIMAVPGRIGAALAALPGIIWGALVGAFDLALYGVGFILGTIFSLITTAPGRIAAGLASLPGLIAGAFTAAWQAASTATVAGVSAVLGWFAALPGRAGAAVSSLWGSISRHFTFAASGAKSKVSELVSGAVSVARSLPGKIGSALSSVKSAVLGAFAAAGSWLTSVGRDMIRGIENGIENAISGAVEAAKKAAKRIVKGFVDALKIGSPSKVMADEVGRWIPPGITQGITAAMPSAMAAMGDLTARLVPAGMGAVGGDSGFGKLVEAIRSQSGGGDVYQVSFGGAAPSIQQWEAWQDRQATKARLRRPR